jgi:hypothetical protein
VHKLAILKKPMVSAHPPSVTAREMPPRHVVPFILGPVTQRVGAGPIVLKLHIQGRNIAKQGRDSLAVLTYLSG